MKTQREELITRIKRMSKEVRKFYADHLKDIFKSNASVEIMEKYISDSTGNLSEKIKELIAGFLSLDKASFQEVSSLWRYLIEKYASFLPYAIRTLAGKKEKKKRKMKERKLIQLMSMSIL